MRLWLAQSSGAPSGTIGNTGMSVMSDVPRLGGVAAGSIRPRTSLNSLSSLFLQVKSNQEVEPIPPQSRRSGFSRRPVTRDMKIEAGYPSITLWSKVKEQVMIGLMTISPSLTTGRSEIAPVAKMAVSG